jgi:anti-anti-sigma factor
VQDGVTTITLAGELDAKSAPEFREEIERSVSAATKRLVLMMKDLDYIASAGLRVLIFARQKMGPGVDIYVVGAQEQVQDTLDKTGFSRSVFSVESYDATTPQSP